MRDLTLAEEVALAEKGCCPFCQTPREEFLLGPEAGLMQNVECPGCEARFNLPADALFDGGQLIREPLLRPEEPLPALEPLGRRSRRSPLAERQLAG
jgi:hypothetical protein